jgi:hypothetical protein
LLSNLYKNKNGKMILTIKKLEMLYFIINNPFLLIRITKGLQLGTVVGYQRDLYEKGFQLSDINNRSEALAAFSFLRELNKVSLSNDGAIEVNDISAINSSSEYLCNNLSIFKKLASMTEAKLIALVSEYS